MRKKKEYPRKRKRFIRKVIFLTTLISVFVVVIAGIVFYFMVVKSAKHPTTHPLPKMQVTQSITQDKGYTELQQGLQKDQIAYSTITKGSNSYIVILQDGGKVTFSSQKDIMSQIASLQYILSHLTMEGRQFSELDLRFDQPVIKLKP